MTNDTKASERQVKRYTFIMTNGFEPDGRMYEIQPREPHKAVHPPERMVSASDYDALAADLASARAELERMKAECDARCDRAYCDGADAALVIAGASQDEAAQWKAGGYGGRRQASRAALSVKPRCENPECEDGQVPDPDACWKPCPDCEKGGGE